MCVHHIRAQLNEYSFYTMLDDGNTVISIKIYVFYPDDIYCLLGYQHYPNNHSINHIFKYDEHYREKQETVSAYGHVYHSSGEQALFIGNIELDLLDLFLKNYFK